MILYNVKITTVIHISQIDCDYDPIVNLYKVVTSKLNG